MNKGKYYITTAIAYASGKPHIGNTYEIILADAIARFKREEGYDVFFQTGTDEHGQKIEEKAKAEGISPKEFVDEKAGEIKRIWDLVNTSYDKFIRTTDEDHKKMVTKIFTYLYEKGDIYKGEYEGWYCTPCESFFTDSQLVDGKCPDCGREVTRAKEEAYFFKMSKYADRLMKYIEENPDFIKPKSREKEMINNFLKPGLTDLCVSRSTFSWGISTGVDERHVVYVWLDALTNYITGIGYNVDGNSSELFNKNWPADLHLIGKDIVRFHTIYWPIFLMALDLPLPKTVFGHPWLLQGDGKMSKSKGNVIYADDLEEVFGVDAVRYFCLHEMPFEQDGVITWDLMMERYNGNLANILGNLVNRSVSMTNKYFGGEVKKINVNNVEKNYLDLSNTLRNDIKSYVNNSIYKMGELKVSDALDEIFNIFKRCNKFIDETMPWVLGKDDSKVNELNMVLVNLIESITIGASLLSPFMTETSEKILLGLRCEKISFDKLENFDFLSDDHKVCEKVDILFNRLDIEETKIKIEELMSKYNKEKIEDEIDERIIDIEDKEEISYDDFMKMQFQIGVIKECVAVEKSKKLIVSKVKVGSKLLQIVSGIRKYYQPEEMVGKRVMVLVNLKKATLAGIESEGMILCAEGDDGELSLMTSDKSVPSGSEIC